MRMESLQTSPPQPGARFILKIVSCVGLTMLVAILLLVATYDSLWQKRFSFQETPLAETGISSVDTSVKERSFNADEFVIPQDNEPRGQWSEKNSRPRIATARSDQELFESRSRELRGGTYSRGPFFQRNSSTTDDDDRLPSRTEPDLRDNSIFDPEPADDSFRKTSPDRSRPPAPPVPEDEWSLPSGPGLREGNGEPVRRRQPEAAQPTEPNRNLSDPTDETRFDDSLDRDFPGPLRSLYNDGQVPAPRDRTSDTGGDWTRDDNNDRNYDDSVNRRRTPQPNNRWSDSTDDSTGDDMSVRPVDLRRGRDLFLSPSSDRQTQYDDLTSVRIDKRYLDVVKDNTVGIRRDESDSFYRLLDYARQIPTATLERAGERDVQYINLMTEPDRFRGEPITIEGDLWRLYELEASRNRYGVTRIYEGWVFTGDSSNHPYRIVCTSLPRGIEPGENLRKPVRITGYFFKREGYKSNGGVHFAPTLLARRIAVNPMPNGIPLIAGIAPWILGAIMAVGLALLVSVAATVVSDERLQRTGLPHRVGQPRLSFAGLDISPPIGVEESLRQLAERERNTAISGAYGPLFSRTAAREHAVHDYSTSHRISIDDGDSRRRQQAGVVQSWAAKQQASQAEIDALRAANARGTYDKGSTADELDSNRFGPARNVLLKSTISSPVQRSSSYGQSGSIGASSSIAASTVSRTHAAPMNPTVTVPPSNIAYGASKLSDWEEEIRKMNDRGTSTRRSNLFTTTVSDNGIADQIERDRIQRELETRHQIERERSGSDRSQLEQLERERLEHERSERERVERDRIERDRQLHDRQLLERLERERRERESQNRQHSHSAHESSNRTDITTYTLASPDHSASDHDGSHRFHSEQTRSEHELPTQERSETDRSHHDYNSHTHHSASTTFNDRLEHERIERERSEHERLERERVERDRQLHERLERERIERERQLHERLERERLERETTHTHREFDRSAGHTGYDTTSTSESTIHDESGLSASEPESSQSSGKRRGGWGWPRRKKGAETAESTATEGLADSDAASSDEISDDTQSSDGSGNSASSSGWGRNRKRRRNWRDGSSS